PATPRLARIQIASGRLPCVVRIRRQARPHLSALRGPSTCRVRDSSSVIETQSLPSQLCLLSRKSLSSVPAFLRKSDKKEPHDGTALADTVAASLREAFASPIGRRLQSPDGKKEPHDGTHYAAPTSYFLILPSAFF